MRRPPLRDVPALLDVLITGGFAAVFVVNIVHHALWQDEVLAWMIALTSATPGALFAALHYDGHPGLWHALIWPLTRLTGDPEAMKLVHAGIGLALIALIGLASPFSRIERVLLLAGYFVSFEYTVISRNYGIGMLLALLYARQRVIAPERIMSNAVLLALLANTNIFANILSAALALEYLIDRVPRGTGLRLAAGASAYASGWVLAVATVWPASDTSREVSQPLALAASPGHLVKTLLRFFDLAFVPIRSDPLAANFALFATDRAEILALWPQILVFVALALAVIWIFRAERGLLLVIALAGAGAVGFGHLIYAAAIRHWGIIFVAFITCLWMQRARRRQFSWPVLVLLALGAIGGVQAAVLQWSMPFSLAGATARWITREGLAEAQIIGVPDTHGPAVAAFLQRPITMLECNCTARRAIYSSARDAFSREMLPTALAAAAKALPGRETILLSAWQLTPGELSAMDDEGIAVTKLTELVGSWMDKAFYLYRVTIRP